MKNVKFSNDRINKLYKISYISPGKIRSCIIVISCRTSANNNRRKSRLPVAPFAPLDPLSPIAPFGPVAPGGPGGP